MNFFQAFIISVVEGITEFLPISSTGHLVLTSKILSVTQTDFVKTFEIAIQSGAIASVIFLYGRKLLDNKELLKKTMAAFIPTGILGFVLYKFVKNVLLGNVFVTLLSLAIGGLAIIILEKYFKHKDGGGDIKTLTYPSAIFIGLAQSLSMIPGVSRSAATILGAMGVGLNRQTAVEFSFILAIPTMLAATGYDLLKSFKDINSSNVLVLIFGFTVSFIVALAAVKWFLNFVKKYSLTSFGVYRIVLSIIYFLLIK